VTDGPQDGEGDNLWTRLRRRKLVQWGLAYAAGAWGLLQGVQFLAEAFEWSSRVLQLGTVAALIGLPIVLIIAWYHGDRGEQRVTRTELAIVTLLFLLGGGLFWRYQQVSETASVAATPAPTAPTAAVAGDNSIAVLPFVNMSSDQEQEYFSDGLSEELLNLLAQVPQLRVIARTSSFSFKDTQADIAEIAQKLNVAHVLEGSVRRSGDTLRITAQLIRAADSSHLWSQTYDRPMTDVFKVQDEIAAAVVDELKIKLLGGTPTARTTDPKAYALYLQARAVSRQSNAEAFEQAIKLYKQALAIDPDYAPAWDGLADVYFNQMDFAVVTLEQGLPRAREAISRALKSDPDHAPAYARLALIEGTIELDVAAGVRDIEQGLALDPANLEVLSSAVMIGRLLGRFDQAIKLARYLVSRDPLNEQNHDRLAMVYLSAGRLDEALAAFRTVLALSPGFGSEHQYIGRILLLQGDAENALAYMQKEPIESWRLIGLVMAYHALGRRAESDAALDELIRKYGTTLTADIAYTMAYRGETDRVFEWLENADRLNFGVGIMASQPMLQDLHSDPRWLPFLRRIGMAPEQLAAIKFDVKLPD
jgi:TolB-like protein/tetratricopeptide (TPR) repeat protein